MATVFGFVSIYGDVPPGINPERAEMPPGGPTVRRIISRH